MQHRKFLENVVFFSFIGLVLLLIVLALWLDWL
jgi:hypothetical protein